MNRFLNWIDNDDLTAAIDELLRRSEKAHINALDRIAANKIDPFASILTAAVVDGISSPDDLIHIQALNSAQQGTTSAIGYFHQHILSSVEGFENHDTGYDIINNDRKILAEIKNKHNTMNASNRQKVEEDLDTAIKQKGRDWSGYLVMVIPRDRERFKTQIKKRKVYCIDGASFYELATGCPTALNDLYEAVGRILLERFPGISQELWEKCREIYTSTFPD